MNLPLKHALIDYPHPAYRVALKLNIHHSTLSKFISGIQEPTPEQKQALAKILGKPVSVLFETEPAEVEK